MPWAGYKCITRSFTSESEKSLFRFPMINPSLCNSVTALRSVSLRTSGTTPTSDPLLTTATTIRPFFTCSSTPGCWLMMQSLGIFSSYCRVRICSRRPTLNNAEQPFPTEDSQARGQKQPDGRCVRLRALPFCQLLNIPAATPARHGQQAEGRIIFQKRSEGIVIE